MRPLLLCSLWGSLLVVWLRCQAILRVLSLTALISRLFLAGMAILLNRLCVTGGVTVVNGLFLAWMAILLNRLSLAG